MKAGWEAAALGQVCDKIQDGAHHSPKNTVPVREPGTFPYVTSKNIRNWYLDEDNVTYVGPEFHDTIYPRCNAEFGDVLLTKDGANTGQVTINTFREPISLLSSVCLIKPSRSKLDPRFLVYYIQSDAGFENITGQMTGAAIKRIILKNIKSSEIPLPPLEEQQRIVAVLDEAFEGLARAHAHAEANLQNARELFARTLDTFFKADRNTWPIVSFGDVSDVKGGKRLPKGYQLQHEATDWPYIRVADFDGKGSVDLTDIRYLTEDVQKSIKQYTISSNDVFITIVGATVGKSGIVPEVLDGANLTENACKLVLRDKVATKYVYYFTISQSFLEQVGLNTRTAAQPKLALTRLKTITMGLPPLERQEAVSTALDRIRSSTQELESNYSDKLQDLDDLRQSLLQKAFAGELT